MALVLLLHSMFTCALYLYEFKNIFYFQPNTFQLVIVYDASRWSTFVIFSYEKTGWDTAFTTRGSMIGYYVTQYGKENTEALGVSGKPISFRMALIKGNTGKS